MDELPPEQVRSARERLEVLGPQRHDGVERL
jgi:hypothetical protein